MWLSDLSSITFSFCIGILFSPFSSGLFYLVCTMILFLVIDYLINGSFEYNYLEYRVSIILYSVIGFLLGRSILGSIVMFLGDFHKKKEKKELDNIPIYLVDIYDKLKFISKLNKDSIFDISNNKILKIKYIYKYTYKKIFKDKDDKIYKYIKTTINDCLNIIITINDKNSYDYLLLKNMLNESIKGIENISKNYLSDDLLFKKYMKLIKKIHDI